MLAMHHLLWTSPYTVLFVLLSLVKYCRLIVNCIAYWSYKPIPIAQNPRFTSQNVTVVVPSLEGDGEELRHTLRSVLRNDPFKILLVTVDANYKKAEKLAASISKRIQVLSNAKANKRLQMCKAMPFVSTEFTVFADDDVIWPPTLLPWMLAPFENKNVGGVGTSQRLRREKYPNFWNFLGAAYLLRRNWDIVACNRMDGGLPCLSGRTVAYRTEIIQTKAFLHAFTHETWRTYLLNADDDNFLTRWLMNSGWDIHIQKHRECEVETTLEGNSKFILQCLRWARSNWRSNLKSLAVERTIWRRHPWSTFAVFQTTLTSWSVVLDALLVWLWWQATAQLHGPRRDFCRVLVYLWILIFCRIVKYIEHFARHPEDIVYIPMIPLFGYYHSCVIKVHALFTLQATTWGSRAGADDNDTAEKRMVALPPYAASLASPSTKDGSYRRHHVHKCDADDPDLQPLLPRYEDGM